MIPNTIIRRVILKNISTFHSCMWNCLWRFFPRLYLLSHCRTLKCVDDNPSLCSSWRLDWIPCVWRKKKSLFCVC